MRNPCKKFAYIDKDGNPVYKNKIKYNTKAEARKKADEMNSQKYVIRHTSTCTISLSDMSQMAHRQKYRRNNTLRKE